MTNCAKRERAGNKSTEDGNLSAGAGTPASVKFVWALIALSKDGDLALVGGAVYTSAPFQISVTRRPPLMVDPLSGRMIRPLRIGTSGRSRDVHEQRRTVLPLEV
jgi:hypothetical protein